MQFRVLLVILFFTAFSQSSQSAYSNKIDDDPLLKKAKSEYASFRFVSAIKILKVILEKDSKNVVAQELIAGSYRNIRDYDEALLWYSKLNKQPSVKPDWVLFYAEALANKEKYEESEQWYRKYQRLVPADQRTAAFVKAGVMSNLSLDKGEWKVSSTNINTPASEYSPIYYNGGLLFTSNRENRGLLKYIFGWDQTPYTDLYVIDHLEDVLNIKSNKEDSADTIMSKTKTLQNKQPVTLKAHFLDGKINSRFHEGPTVSLADGSLIFTRNNFYKGKAGSSKKGINMLKLYTATGINLNHIKGFPFNSDEYSVGHPAISMDGNTLYFASDMPGTFGGTDIYYSKRSSANRPWGKPVNMGRKINTEGNEQFPYIDKLGRLIFSSTGHPGLGGLDIFEITFKNNKPIGPPRNLGAPFNSSADDFGFIRSDDEKSGYFSSNRNGNDDIYHYNRLTNNVILKGRIVDATSNLPLSGSLVSLRNNLGSENLPVSVKGEFYKVLNKESEYEVSGNNSNYMGSSTSISTIGIEADSTINILLKLDKPEVFQKYVLKHCDSLKKVLAVNNIYYDLDKWDIREDSHSTLETLVNLMNTYPNVKIITSSHTDSRATNQYNKSLSFHRGQSVKDYLIAKGVDSSRIQIRYYGKSRLVNRCNEDAICTEEEQQLNRRTEFEIILNGVNLSQLDCSDN